MAVPHLKPWDVVVVGEIFADHVFTGFPHWPRPGEEVIAEGYVRELGGGSVNTACGLSRLGRRVRLVGLIGDADFDWFEQRLGEFGVGMGGIRLEHDGTGITVSVSMRDDRTFFTYPGANRGLPELLTVPAVVSDLAAARHVHFAMPLSRDLAMSLLPALRAAGCTTSLDVGHTPTWLTDAANIATCREVDLFLPNTAEAELACGDASAEAYVAWAACHGLSRAVLKRGAQGALAASGGVLSSVSPPVVEAIDTTGAGDAFNAGLIDAWLDDEPLGPALERACICGALCSTAPGALAALPDSPHLRTLRERTYRS
ncbi:carbohydrate kinase family protein [Luteibacter aegosomaticola]|uniref:carbohydrate kinase family protein n=1 Tax=Luteibacter aegosomaticola TaxID=2911538 RepID=UPI001FFB28F2|nr:carbohydrate kinase family protein [Luteibacter aegosomaticola]UPG88028.1 carbohydrate kinase family protein [Luteibacter aegosomaticola]